MLEGGSVGGPRLVVGCTGVPQEQRGTQEGVAEELRQVGFQGGTLLMWQAGGLPAGFAWGEFAFLKCFVHVWSLQALGWGVL